MSASPSHSQFQWHHVYQEAILELDDRKVPGLIERARKYLAKDLPQLDPQIPDQRRELDRALNALRMLALLDKTMTRPSPQPEAS
jgi:hypothetical protein